MGLRFLRQLSSSRQDGLQGFRWQSLWNLFKKDWLCWESTPLPESEGLPELHIEQGPSEMKIDIGVVTGSTRTNDHGCYSPGNCRTCGDCSDETAGGCLGVLRNYKSVSVDSAKGRWSDGWNNDVEPNSRSTISKVLFGMDIRTLIQKPWNN